MRRGVGGDGAHAGAGQVLSDGVALHIVRRGAGLSLPMGGCLSRPRMGRVCGDARVFRHRGSGLRLCVEDRRIGMGVERSVPQNLPDTATLDLLLATFQEDVQEISTPQGDATVVVRPDGLKRVMKFLKNDPRTRFNLLVDITAVDYQGRKPRFDVVYHLLSLSAKRRLRIKVRVEESNPEIDSMTSLWGSANWLEREVWDMFGIRFTGHPNLKRILMYEEFKGDPLRKDYPVNKRQPLIGPKN